MLTSREIVSTLEMLQSEHLDLRTVTLGINLMDCADPDLESTCEKVYAKILHHARDLVATADAITADYGVPIVNKRIASAITGISAVSSSTPSGVTPSAWRRPRATSKSTSSPARGVP